MQLLFYDLNLVILYLICSTCFSRRYFRYLHIYTCVFGIRKPLLTSPLWISLKKNGGETVVARFFNRFKQLG